jgi:hypothetical protein
MGKRARSARREGERQHDGGQAALAESGGRTRRRLIVALAALVPAGLVAAGLIILNRTPVAAPVADAGAPRDAGPAPVTEVEPNDTPAQAQPLPRLPATVTGTLTPGDKDHYRLTISEPGGHVIDAWIDGLPGARLRALSQDGTELAAVSAPARIGALGVAKGAYLLAVEPGDGAATGAYRLTVRVEPWVKGMDWEPNDDPKHQQPMASLTAREGDLARHRARGAWSRPGDVDCFTVPFTVPPEGAQMRLELRPPPGVRGWLEVLDQGDAAAKIAPRRLAAVASDAPGRPAVLPAMGARSWESSYVACLRAEAGDDPGRPYTLDARVWTPRTAFEFEPNDERATASALPLNVAVEGYLTTGDVDWYRVSAGAPGEVEVTVRAPVAVEVALCDADGRELGVATGTARQPVAVKRPAAVFARVRPTGPGDVAATYSVVARPAQEAAR